MDTVKLLLLTCSQLFVCQSADDQARLWDCVRRHDSTLLRGYVRREGDIIRVDPLMLARVARAVTVEGFKLVIA